MTSIYSLLWQKWNKIAMKPKCWHELVLACTCKINKFDMFCKIGRVMFILLARRAEVIWDNLVQKIQNTVISCYKYSCQYISYKLLSVLVPAALTSIHGNGHSLCYYLRRMKYNQSDTIILDPLSRRSQDFSNSFVQTMI